MMKKRIFVFSTILIVLLLCVIGLTVSDRNDDVITVGICQFAQHESLDAATRGFCDALTEELDSRIVFDEQNANGDLALCTEIIQNFIFQDVNLILANSTASLQVAAGVETDIPILGTAVTEYGALAADGSAAEIPANISGTSDLVPARLQADMIQELFPEASNIGMLYCSSEANSQYQADALQEELTAMGYDCQSFLFTNSNDLSSVTMTAASQCDVLFIPTDNTVAANAGLIANICMPENVPVITGDESTCRLCGVATVSVDYYDLGYTTGKMAAEILKEGRPVSDLPIQYASSFTKKFNHKICRMMHIPVPDDYVKVKHAIAPYSTDSNT